MRIAKLEQGNIKAKAELTRRGFVFSRVQGNRQYWKRTDGQPEVFYDHSATITRVGKNKYVISDFVNDIKGRWK